MQKSSEFALHPKKFHYYHYANGGPLMWEENGDFVFTGIVSRAQPGCAIKDQPGVYVGVFGWHNVTMVQHVSVL